MLPCGGQGVVGAGGSWRELQLELPFFIWRGELGDVRLYGSQLVPKGWGMV